MISLKNNTFLFHRYRQYREYIFVSGYMNTLTNVTNSNKNSLK